MSGPRRLPALRYIAAFTPGLSLIFIAFLIGAHQHEADRARRVADYARLAAASVDLRFGKLLELTVFCASAPALIERVNLDGAAENCGRYAALIGAWVVIVETGETHRQILNTRPGASASLPIYPRGEEYATLLALEERSRRSGAPGIADVFTGMIYPRGVVSAGQHLRLADGRSAMLYVGFSAQALSDQLAGLAAEGGPIFGLIDPSRRVVARSVGIERAMFAEAPDWFLGFLETGAAGASLGVPGPDVIGGIWDAGYHPVNVAPGWTAAAFRSTPAGAPVWALVSLPAAVTLLGLVLSGIILWMIAERDQTARRVVAARRAVAESERRNREKSRLLATFAHDVRSPMVSLIGSLEMIEEGRDAGSDQVRTVRGSAEALLQLVDDILELSFLGSGALTFHPSPVDLRQLAAELLDQTRPTADRKGLALRLDLDPHLPPTVEVDRLRLRQILSNLLTNAVKYTERGSVTLRIRQEAFLAGRVALEIAVIDTGIGLAPEDIPRILREFGRLEREAERREQGVGLGLPIVQRILHAMGASLTVESAPGQGSTFGFRLSLPAATGVALEGEARPLSGIVVLYAEDEPVIRQVTSRRLEAAGARVIGAVDGEDALRQLGGVTPDLLLVDLDMPRLDGAGVIRRLNEIAPERPYPLFALTSHISGPRAAEARAAGADAIFTKPVQVAALAAAFRARHGNGGHSTPLVGDFAEAADEPLVDPERFRETMDIMGAPSASSLVARFEESMRRDLAALEAATDAKDQMQVGELAHRCRGLCLVMGAASLARRLRDIEREAAGGDMAAVRPLMGGTFPLLEATLREMRSALEADGPEGPGSGR